MTSWKIAKEIKKLGKWNRIFLAILWTWTLLIAGTPYLNEENSTGDLSGSVGKYDNEEVVEKMNPISRVVYYLGDVNCHQLSHRSYEYNGNQMSFCARDFGIFLGLAMGFTYSLGRRIELTLPLIILALTPIGIDGTVQLLTDYESTNPRRIITGLIAGVATGIALKIIADSLDKR
ncbi:MAG: hypothetical protein CL872_01880 [Dehalococcoidaceae bacterium]|nr:hypothetical protein [Dehalococcoidaceae bacterium]